MILLVYNTIYYLYRDMYIKFTSQFAHNLSCFFVLAYMSQIGYKLMKIKTVMRIPKPS